MPVNTRWMMLLMVLVTVGGNFGMVPLAYLYFDPELVMKFQVRSSQETNDDSLSFAFAFVRCGDWSPTSFSWASSGSPS
jgi:hypothetical protein